MQLTSLSLALTRAGFLSAFSPASLFALGEQGAWYDPSDIKLDWRYNLLTRTEEFDNAVWVKFNSTVTANVVDAPDDTLTADKLVESASSGIHRVEQSIVTTASLGYSFSICVQAAERSKLRLVGVNTSGTSGGFFASFDLSSGTTGGIQSFGDGVGVSAEIQSSESEWLIATIKGSKGSATPFAFSVRLEDGSGNETYTGNGTSGIYIWGASLTTAANADKSYQKITDGVSDYFTYQPQPVLFTDAAGTTPVTAVEQPVGLMLDKSKRLVLGPELVTNGDFGDGTTGWTAVDGSTPIAVVGGEASIGPGAYAQQAGRTFSSGKSYKITFSVRGSGADIQPRVFVATGPYLAGEQVVHTSTIAAYVGGAQLSAVFTPTTAKTVLVFKEQFGVSGTMFIDNISVKELPGNHAFQTTATSRPVLSARVNLLTKTEQFDDVAWTPLRTTVTANTAIAPDGTLTADLLTEDSATNTHYLATGSTTWPTQQYTVSIFAKQGPGNRRLSISQSFGGAVNHAIFDLSSGTLVSTSGENTSSITSVGDGWYRCAVTYTTTSTTARFDFALNQSGNTGLQLYTGDGTSGIYIWGASIVPANQSSLPYQRINTATDYDAGPAFPRYLRCDGIDDGMVTGTITPGTDKAQVFAGVRKLSDAASGMLMELSVESGVNPGSFGMVAPSASGANSYRFQSRGALWGGGAAGSGVFATAPDTSVLSGIGSISEDVATLRRNGVLVETYLADQGTGNYLAYPLYLFRRGGTTLPFNGHFYGGIIRFGDNLPIETIQQTEAYMAAKTGVTL